MTDRKKQIHDLAMADTVSNGKIALPVIMGIEVLMILNWFFVMPQHWRQSADGVWHLVGYIALLLCSGAVLWMIHRHGKDTVRMQLTQDIYAGFFVVWSLLFTLLDAHDGNGFSVIIYVTIITIVPVICYLPMGLWFALEGIGSVAMLVMGWRWQQSFSAYAANFLIFVLVSVISTCAYVSMRRRNYTRLLELEDASYSDALTGLKNRRSADEMMEKLQQEENLTVVCFDVNNLKRTNDTQGHKAGDDLLIRAAECIRESFGEGYRTGGDEFMVFSLDFRPEQVEDFRCLTRAREISVAVGYASSAEHPGATPEELERLADAEMYRDKACDKRV